MCYELRNKKMSPDYELDRILSTTHKKITQRICFSVHSEYYYYFYCSSVSCAVRVSILCGSMFHFDLVYVNYAFALLFLALDNLSHNAQTVHSCPYHTCDNTMAHPVPCQTKTSLRLKRR